MSFRWLGVAVLMASVVGCAKSQVPNSLPVTVQLNGGGSQCLSQFQTKFNLFKTSQLSDQQLSDFWDCVGQTLATFSTVTEGDLPGGYSPQALRHFLQTFFLNNHPISDSMLSEIMVLKRVLLSGSVTLVTPQELTQAQVLIGQLKSASRAVLPYASVLFGSSTNVTDAQLTATNRALQLAADQLSQWLLEQDQSYAFSDLSMLVAQVQNWNSPVDDDTVKATASVQSVLNLLPPVKALLVGGHPQEVNGQEWGTLLTAAARGFDVYLTSRDVFATNLDAGLMRAPLPQSVQQFLLSLRLAAATQPGNVLPLPLWQTFFTAVVQTGWLPSNVTAPELMALWQWILERPLGDGVTPATGLTVTQIDQLSAILKDWATLITASPQDTSLVVQSFNRILGATPPQQWDTQGRLVFPLAGATLSSWDSVARAQMAWNFVILDWLKTAYAGSTAESLTQDQVNMAVGEILPLLQNLGWLQSTSLTVGTRLLREADLFTPASNGNGLLELSEATRYLAFVMSSFRSAQVWLAQAQSWCGGVSVDCVRSLPLNPNSGVIDSMPRLKTAMQTWSSSQFIQYMEHAESTVLHQIETGTFSTGDLLEVWQLFQYVEIFIELYDQNHSETIDVPEAEQAFVVYGPTLNRLFSGTGLSNSDLLGFFTFMMKYGDTPFTMFGGQVAFDYWRWHTDTWAFEAPRDTLMSILNQLSQL